VREREREGMKIVNLTFLFLFFNRDDETIWPDFGIFKKSKKSLEKKS
jgi:hypothetical protein